MPKPPTDPMDRVRARFPRTPDADHDGLCAQDEHLATLRSALDPARRRDMEPAMTFDPTKEVS